MTDGVSEILNELQKVCSTKYYNKALPIVGNFGTQHQKCQIDLGKLAFEWVTQNTSDNLRDFVAAISSFLNGDANDLRPKMQIVHFGRIGRLVARELIIQDGAGDQLRLKPLSQEIIRMKT